MRLCPLVKTEWFSYTGSSQARSEGGACEHDTVDKFECHRIPSKGLKMHNFSHIFLNVFLLSALGLGDSLFSIFYSIYYSIPRS